MSVLGTSKLGHDNKTTIIKEVVDRLDLKKGDIIVYHEEDGEIIIRKG